MSNAKDAVRKVLDAVKADKRTSLTAPEGKLVCDAYGIPVPKEGVAKSAGDAAKIASGMGFPVVMKAVSADLPHKSDAGAVVLGIDSVQQVRNGLRQIIRACAKHGAQLGLRRQGIVHRAPGIGRFDRLRDRRLGPVQAVLEGRQQGVDHQAGLARPRHARHAHEHPQGDVDVDVAEAVHRGAGQ